MVASVPKNAEALKFTLGREWAACNFGTGYIPKDTIPERDLLKYFKQWRRKHREGCRQLHKILKSVLKTEDCVFTLKELLPDISNSLLDELGEGRYIARQLDLGVRSTIPRAQFVQFLELLHNTIR